MRKTSLSFLALSGASLLFPGVSLAQSLIYSNGGLNPQAVANNGTPAPAGFFWSEAQNDTGNTTESNTNAGYTITGTFRLADDFVVPAGATWTVEAFDFYSYQTGSAPSPSPIAGHTLQVWNGRPGDAGAAVIFGDTTTNRQVSSLDSLSFRLFNSAVPPPGSPTGTTRKIWRNRVQINPPLVLTEGTYWVDWAATAVNAGNLFAPAVTIAGARGQAGWNAVQLTAGVWTGVIDAGNPNTAPDIPQDFPFDVIGTTLTDAVFSNGFEG